ncbi:MAG: hypothetical protein HZA54_13100 [Planctomycetes bacterium]|nr:hypothetical protein [Planctomycetota bacterium]
MRFRYRVLAVLAMIALAPVFGALDPLLGIGAILCAGLAAAGLLILEYALFCPPVELRLTEPDPGGLRYPLESRGLWGLDPEAPGARIALVEGVPHVRYGGALGERANPAYVAWWGLAWLSRFVAAGGGGEAHARALAAVRAAAGWLRAHARERCGPAGRAWSYDFDWPNGAATLRAPWISAMAQGLAISFLLRAARALDEPDLAALAQAATEPFRHDLDAGGVRTVLGGHPFYEEYPIRPETLVLDGSLFGLVGLGEAAQASGDAEAARMFREGAAGIAANLARWEYAGGWSRYGRFGALAGADYHLLNALLLQVVGRAAGRPELVARGARWEHCARSLGWRVAMTLANRWVQVWERRAGADR